MINSMKLLSCLACVMLLAAPAAAGQAKPDPKAKPAAPAAKTAKGVRTITITGNDQMKFDVARIDAKPGERLRVVLKAVGNFPKTAMAHNFVLLKEGANAAEVNKAAMNARETEFIPAAMKAQIHAFTKLAGAGETVEVTFNAPTKPGTYEYLCTFPGHYLVGMKGELVVK